MNSLRRIGRRVADLLVRDVRTDLSGPAHDLRSSPATKVALRQFMRSWHEAARSGPIDLRGAGLRVFSQTDDDGIVLAIFAAVGTTNQTFVDIGAATGVNSNCANLAVNLGWHGLMLEGDAASVAIGEAWYREHPDTFLYPPVFRQAMVTRENINALIQDAGFSGAIDFLSLDIDGNDYWIWEALAVVQPRVVMVEANPAFANEPVTIPYDPAFVHTTDRWTYYGAGREAFVRLAQRKGYRLVAANLYGFNLFFVRSDLGERALPTVTTAQVCTHPRLPATAERFALPLLRVDHTVS